MRINYYLDVKDKGLWKLWASFSALSAALREMRKLPSTEAARLRYDRTETLYTKDVGQAVTRVVPNNKPRKK